MGQFRFIQVDTARGVQTITLNRPEKRNALSPELIDELTQVLEHTSTCDCGVVILTGAGSLLCRSGHGASGNDDSAHGGTTPA